jgi:type IV secretion system protein VirB7
MIAFLKTNTKSGRRIGPAVLIAILTTLGGCASLTYPLPKCDGYSRRPLNRSMWDWEGDLKRQREDSSARSTTSATPYVEEGRSTAAFAQFNIDGSYRRCTG